MQCLLTGTPKLRDGHTAAGVTNESKQRQIEINTHEEETNNRVTNNLFLKVLQSAMERNI